MVDTGKLFSEAGFAVVDAGFGEVGTLVVLSKMMLSSSSSVTGVDGGLAHSGC